MSLTPEYVNSFRKPKTVSSNLSSNALEPSTTGLSPYITTGSLSVRLLWEEVEKANRLGPHSAPPESLHGQLLFREMFYLLSLSVPNWDNDLENSMCKRISWEKKMNLSCLNGRRKKRGSLSLMLLCVNWKQRAGCTISADMPFLVQLVANSGSTGSMGAMFLSINYWTATGPLITQTGYGFPEWHLFLCPIFASTTHAPTGSPASMWMLSMQISSDTGYPN